MFNYCEKKTKRETEYLIPMKRVLFFAPCKGEMSTFIDYITVLWWLKLSFLFQKHV